MNKSQGFTIIELLVVVAIISVLAAIVLVNVTGYINQGKNAAIKGNISTILTNAAVHYDLNGDYATFFASSGYTGPELAAANASGVAIAAIVEGLNTTTNITWCSCAPLKTTTLEPAGSTFCVDASGYKLVTLTACATRCTNGAGGTNGACQP